MKLTVLKMFAVSLLTTVVFLSSSQSAEKTIYFNAWAGNEKINQYIKDQSDIFYKKTGIKVVHVKVAGYQPVIKTIQAEKRAGNLTDGSIDVLWINGENFAALKGQNLLYGPLTSKVSNFKKVDESDPSFQSDFNIQTEGYEVPWGRAQFVFIWDKAQTPKPPENASELLAYAKAHAGKLSYVKPPQFHGVTFLKQLLLDLSVDPAVFQKSCELVDRVALSQPLWAYLDLLHPYLWRKAQTFPLSVEKMHQMLLDHELLMSMSFNPLESDSLVQKKEVPEGAFSVTFKKGGIGNIHFLSIPFNSKNRESSLLWINHLLSIDAQAEKSNIRVWGDPTVLDISKLEPATRKRFPDRVLKGPLLFEPHACWMTYLQDEWVKRYGSGVK
jgi:putative thiamine transport system substrate-binding protein